MTMTAGQVIPSYIELKNTGTKTWDSSTARHDPAARPLERLRRRHVARAPTGSQRSGGRSRRAARTSSRSTSRRRRAPARYDEYFGVVQEGVAWFSDPGQGGPPDNDLEVKIAVGPGDGGPPPTDAGAHASDAGAAHDAGGTAADAGHAGDSGGVVSPGADAGGGSSGGGSSSGATSSGGGGDAGGWDGASPGQSGGCSVGAAGGASPWASALGMMLAVGGLGRRAMRRRR